MSHSCPPLTFCFHLAYVQLGHTLPISGDSDLVVNADVVCLQHAKASALVPSAGIAARRCITLLHADDMLLNVPRYSSRCVRGFEAARLRHATLMGFDVNVLVIEEWEALEDDDTKLAEISALLV